MKLISYLLSICGFLILENREVLSQNMPSGTASAKIVGFARQLSIDTARAAEIGRIYADFNIAIMEVLEDTMLHTSERQQKLRPLLQARQEQLRQLLSEAEYMRLSEHYGQHVVGFRDRREKERAARKQLKGKRVSGATIDN